MVALGPPGPVFHYPALVTTRSGRGSRERVEAARRRAALALGRDPDQRDSFVEPPNESSDPVPTTSTNARLPEAGRGIGVLSLGEAAARLGMSRSEVEGLIDRGAVEALQTGFTRMIPTREVERLRKGG
jgi:excisionase family DNA binding protein